MGIASLLRSAVVGIVAAVGAVVITFFIADLISGPLMATQPGADGPQDVPLGGAVFGTVIGGLVGTVLAVVIARLKGAVPIFLLVCLVGLVLYGWFALSAAETQSTGIWLNVMHIAAAVPIVGQLTRWISSRPPKVAAATDAPSIDDAISTSPDDTSSGD